MSMKLTGTDRQTGGQADRQRIGKPMFWEAAPPKITEKFLEILNTKKSLVLIFCNCKKCKIIVLPFDEILDNISFIMCYASLNHNL